MNELCQVMQVSTSGFYHWLQGKPSQRQLADERMGAKLIAIFRDSQGRYGAPRLHAALKKSGETIGRKRVIRLMKVHGLQAKGKRKFKATTDSNHPYPYGKNLLAQQFNIDQPNSVFAGDITYISTQEGWLYLAVVLDLFSRKVVGWAMDKRMTRQLVKDAFLMAYWQSKPTHGAIHHSDKGSQYASFDFQEMLKAHGFRCSMSGRGNCYDNAVVETFFHSLKVELVHDVIYQTREEAKSSIFNYIEVFYNKNRLHSTLGYCSPEEFEQQYWLRKVA